MSHVTNIILSVGGLEDGCPHEGDEFVLVAVVNDWLKWNGSGVLGYLDPANEAIGGQKCLEADIYIAAFNYLDVPVFLETVFTQPWKSPSEVQVFLKEQDDDKWSLVDLANWREFAKEGEP